MTGRQRSIWHCDDRIDRSNKAYYRMHLHSLEDLKQAGAHALNNNLGEGIQGRGTKRGLEEIEPGTSSASHARHKMSRSSNAGSGGASNGKRGRQPGQKMGPYTPRTRTDNLGPSTLRAVCQDLGLPYVGSSDAEMRDRINEASGATGKKQKTNLDPLSVETLKRICADRELEVENESAKTALIALIRKGVALNVARHDETLQEGGGGGAGAGEEAGSGAGGGRGGGGGGGEARIVGETGMRGERAGAALEGGGGGPTPATNLPSSRRQRQWSCQNCC